MTRVELSKLARLQLHHIARSRLQPEFAIVTVERGLGQLARQPLSGQAVGGQFTGTRVLVVGRPQILIHHLYDADRDVVSVLGFLDVRAPGVPEP